ncbi:hypothetical protein PBY51_003495 [Eleginops maclovinus]|uniref:Uncharacterized protein n=1 Tax=Eleginops maclovinus TaxID=56733 RepID=A0AAN7XUZ6_ELEMC|nr:hypothetical protein PBY51_003495 [Eleginops maclovinus]
MVKGRVLQPWRLRWENTAAPPERSPPHPPSHREQLPSGFHDNQRSCHRLCSENEGGKRMMPPSAEHHCLEQGHGLRVFSAG